MGRWRERCTSILLMFVLILGLCGNAVAVGNDALDKALTDTAKYLYETVETPRVGSIGGEWVVIGLARSEYAVPKEYYQKYYAAVEDYVVQRRGVLHEKKYTEYSRVIVALAAIGKDARDVASYDLTKPLGDYERTIWQGLNGPIWALIALDSRDYPMPENPEAKIQATRQMYIDRILDCQLSNGGWSLLGTAADGRETADPDITGMALQALAKYCDQSAVAAAVEQALACMSAQQNADGGFSSWGTANSESCAQMIVALCELGVPLDDVRFVKNGNTMLDNLLTFYTSGKGFRHTKDGGGSDQMASEQGLYSLVAAQRAVQGRNSLYRMSDVTGDTTRPDANVSEGGSDAAIKIPEIIAPGTTFTDVKNHTNQAAIEELASRGIINGMGSGAFAPDRTMTRAEFAAIITRALGLDAKDTKAFTDVPGSKWYAGYVGAANSSGIVNGIGNKKFNPDGTITRQEAAAMVARAAKVCGLDTSMDAAVTKDMLAQFGDYRSVASWAKESMAFCYSAGILDQSDLDIEPAKAILRCEIAQMLYNMLTAAELI
mgnify:CR=1 FL=1